MDLCVGIYYYHKSFESPKTIKIQKNSLMLTLNYYPAMGHAKEKKQNGNFTYIHKILW